MNGNLWLAGTALAWIAAGMIGCAGLPPGPPQGAAAPAEPQQTRVEPPVITQSFASPKLRPGETWRVYLVASDPHGEMKQIVCTIDQAGVGTYGASITPIDPEDSKEMNGYIYLATSTSERLDGVYLTLTVQIQDGAGRYSQPVAFPLAFNNLYEQESPPPGIFGDHDLGPILIQLHGLRDEDLGPSIFFPRIR